MIDPSPGILAELTPPTRERALIMLNAYRRAGVPLMATSGRRNIDEQRRLVAAGRSRTLDSAHLRGEAFDVDIRGWKRDQIPRWFWDHIGPFGEALGLVWGGRWRSLWDPGHFELPRRT